MNRVYENNQVEIIGEIVANFEFNHEVYGEGFYKSEIAVARLSGFTDYIPIMVSERLLDVKADWRGQSLKINGTFRSFNKHTDTGSHLVLSVFATDVEVLDVLVHTNEIFLDGYICKQPVYRKTLLGREITDVLVAVNRGYGKSDYIPCILWGRNARFGAIFEVGTNVKFWGRIQSREYVKKISDTETEHRVAYEVSVSKVEV